MFVKVILTQNTKAIDMAFTYRLPESMISTMTIGKKVIVPFGQGNRMIEGFVLSIDTESELKRLKNVYQIVEGFELSSDQMALVEWLKENYLCTYNEALTVVVPTGTKLVKTITYFLKTTFETKSTKQHEVLKLLKQGPEDEKTFVDLNLMATLKALEKKNFITKEVVFKQEVKTIYKSIVVSKLKATELEHAFTRLSKNASKQRKVLEFITNVGQCDVSLLNRELKSNKATLDKLVALDYVEVYEVEKNRQPVALQKSQTFHKFPLNEAQEDVYNSVNQHIDHHGKFLLHGITGSGKTEVYMTLAETVVSKGKQVIILVPEISLTPQMVSKFLKRFGQDIAVVHSKVSPGERYDQYRSIAAGEVSIVIGARSAIFSPCQNLGMIIIDEEHENTYKSDSNPKYSTVEVAEYLALKYDIPLMVASATPSLISYHKTQSDYQLLELSQRHSTSDLPEVYLVDMREELNSGNKTMFSELLIEKIQEKLEREEQVILFYNRKGYSTFVSCRSCGYALKCPRCDIALTYHQKNNEAKCSYCDYKIRVPKKCPECESTYFKYFGAGTEKIESMVQEIFPDARIARLDSESTAKKGALEKIIEDVENREIDILLGTQMVTKGLDFKDVTLVGALSADISLNLPDYRAPEKTFQLLTQVAGRAGRGQKKGEVVIQTYTPEHYAIQSAVEQDYHAFLKDELSLREAFRYPPYVEIVSLLVIGENEDHVIKSIHNLHHELKRFLYKRLKPEDIEILGPNPAVFQKINNKYRWQIILKFDKMDLVLVRNIINYVCITHRDKVVMNDVYINININPLSLL